MKQFFLYLKESVAELKLVTWPGQEELLRLTIITVIFILITSFLTGFTDFGLGKFYQWWLSLNS